MSSRGVDFYVTGVAEVKVHFPNGVVRCQYCPFIKYESAFSRYSCLVTGAWVLNPLKEIAEHCPLEFKETSNDGG